MYPLLIYLKILSITKKGIKGNTDVEVGHRTDFSEICQNTMKNIIKSFEEFFKDPTMKDFMEANYILFNAPSVVYITVPKKRTLYNIFDTGAIEMSVIAI